MFSSVAGVRVRRANYVYGSAKAGLDGFASRLADAARHRAAAARAAGVRHRAHDGGDGARALRHDPDLVADATVRALRAGRGEVWVPAVLRVVFAGMRLLPRPVWRRLPR